MLFTLSYVLYMLSDENINKIRSEVWPKQTKTLGVVDVKCINLVSGIRSFEDGIWGVIIGDEIKDSLRLRGIHFP